MKKTLIRLYDREDKNSLVGKCYFLVLDGTYEELSDDEYWCILNSVARMSWQNYTSFAVATCDDIKEEELFWSEIMDYKMHEVKIDVERLTIIGKYKLPQCITG